MPEDGISLLSFFSLGDFKKEEAERVSVVVRFWPSLRSWHVSYRLETPLLCQWAQLIYKPNMSPKRKPRASPRAHIWLKITYPNSLLNQSCATLWGLQQSVQGSFPVLPKATTQRTSEACYSCAAYSWMIWSPWFTNSITLLDHPHVLNVITLILQCDLL